VPSRTPRSGLQLQADLERAIAAAGYEASPFIVSRLRRLLRRSRYSAGRAPVRHSAVLTGLSLPALLEELAAPREVPGAGSALAVALATAAAVVQMAARLSPESWADAAGVAAQAIRCASGRTSSSTRTRRRTGARSRPGPPPTTAEAGAARLATRASHGRGRGAAARLGAPGRGRRRALRGRRPAGRAARPRRRRGCRRARSGRRARGAGARGGEPDGLFLMTRGSKRPIASSQQQPTRLLELFRTNERARPEPGPFA
jgi:hypothetical protein